MSKDRRQNKIATVSEITVDLRCVSGIKFDGKKIYVLFKGNARFDTIATKKQFLEFKKEFELYIGQEQVRQKKFYEKGRRVN